MASFLARREDHFQNEMSPKQTFPSDFVKLGSKILYLFLAEKMVVCCLLVCLSDFSLLFFKIEALIELRKMLIKKKLFDVRFGNCSTSKVPGFCRFTGFAKMQLT